MSIKQADGRAIGGAKYAWQPFPGSRLVSIPNLITLMRAILVPVVFWLLLSGYIQAAFLVFVVAGVSDAVDGLLARRFNWQTELGAYMDPLADKLLIVSIFVALGVRGDLPSWLVVAVVSRDVLILLAIIVSWLMDKPIKIEPLNVSKATTVAQLALAALVLADEGFVLGLGIYREALVWITAVLTVASLAAYLRSWLTHMSRD